MSTRSFIVKKENGKYKAIYCHFDGYLSGVGETLFKYYTDEHRVDDLINLGDLSCLGEYITPLPNGKHIHFGMVDGKFDKIETYSNEHTFDNPQENVCIAYHRDRGEEYRLSEYEDLDDLISGYENSWCEYMYIYDNGTWYYYEKYTNCEPKLKLLKDGLAEEEKRND